MQQNNKRKESALKFTINKPIFLIFEHLLTVPKILFGAIFRSGIRNFITSSKAKVLPAITTP